MKCSSHPSAGRQQFHMAFTAPADLQWRRNIKRSSLAEGVLELPHQQLQQHTVWQKSLLSLEKWSWVGSWNDRQHTFKVELICTQNNSYPSIYLLRSVWCSFQVGPARQTHSNVSATSLCLRITCSTVVTLAKSQARGWLFLQCGPIITHLCPEGQASSPTAHRK